MTAQAVKLIFFLNWMQTETMWLLPNFYTDLKFQKYFCKSTLLQLANFHHCHGPHYLSVNFILTLQIEQGPEVDTPITSLLPQQTQKITAAEINYVSRDKQVLCNISIKIEW